MKKILGLDLGTNSIGFALIEIDHEKRTLKIIALGSRIIPMDGQEFSKFNAGQKIESAAGNRTKLHRARITKERYLLRRDRLNLILNLMEALPAHYKIEIDFERNGEKCGQFKEGKEPKIAYLPIKNEEKRFAFYYEDAFNEMIADLQKVNPSIDNKKGRRVPKDWTIYYLRSKALKEKISLEELAWVLLSYNQKRGYEQAEIEDENQKSDEIKEMLDLKVLKVEHKADKNGEYDEITLNDVDNFIYKEYSTKQQTFVDDIKEVIKISKLDGSGNIIGNKITYQISDLYNLTLAEIKHTDIDDKMAKHKYDFVYINGWSNEKKSKKANASFQKMSKEIAEGKKITNLFVVKNTYDLKGNPVALEPTIKVPNFNNEGSKDWTLLKKKTEKDAIAYNIENGYLNEDGSAKHFISPKIYSVLIHDVLAGERTKIIGGLFQTINRKFYREELHQIIETQREHYSQTLDDKGIFEKSVKLLYPHNEDHAKALLENKKAIAHLLVDDLLLYQRPLKSKKSEITDCKYEIDYWEQDVNTSTGEITEIPVSKKAVSVSHPLYQEYRIWDKIHNVKLIQLEKQNEDNESETNVDVTSFYFKTSEDYLALFDLFNNQRSVTLNNYLEFCKKRFNLNIGKANERNYIWNYPVEEEFKGNETRKSFEIRFKRCGFIDFDDFLTQEKEIELWHYLYSVNFKERTEIGKTGKSSIQNFLKKYLKSVSVDSVVFEKLCNDFANYPKFDSNYGTFSVKALAKLLSVMRTGNNFLLQAKGINNWQNKIFDRANTILEKTKQIDWNAKDVDYSKAVVTDVNQRKGELPFPKGLFNTFKDFSTINDFQFLNLTQASYLIYGRHSELAVAKFWDSPQKIREEINKELKHHSLNNPVAEKVLKETMKVVADIWEYHGNSAKNFFSEIHVEVARELQKSNEEKKEINENQKNSRSENERLRNLLEDFLCNSPYNAKKGNQDHFERLKIVEEGARIRSFFDKQFYTEHQNKFLKKDIDDLLKKQRISKTDFEKYKLWIEQGYKSPYTNKTIKLSDLFNGSKYNIDHILPRAAVTNDSLNNKIVCEKEINKEKLDFTGRAFVANFQGRKFHTMAHGEVTIMSEEEYVDLVKKQFAGGKRFILLSKDVPNGFTDSQMNNAKHIARKAMEFLSHIVRKQGEVEFRAKNILPVTGAVTDRLRKEWRFHQVWTALLTLRFERLNKLFETSEYGKYVLSENGHSYFDINTKYVLEQNKNFELKRIDHRHHALDALVIALCTQNHVQYINNVNSGITNKKKEKLAAIKKQRAGIKRQIIYSEKNNENPNETTWSFMLPGSFRQENTEGSGKESVCNVKWSNASIEQDTSDYKKVILDSLEHCIVTFKNDFKLVSKSSNKYESYYDEDGNLRTSKSGKPIKAFISQKNEENKHWSIRKSLHTDNPSGKIELQFDQLKITDNLGKIELIKDENLKDSVKEILGIHDNKIGEAKKYLEKNPIKVNEVPIIVTDFKIVNFKFRKKQPILNLAIRTGQGALTTLDQVKDRIYKVVDLKLRDELLIHLRSNEDDIDKAFSIEGIEAFNANRKIPVKRLPICESSELKFAIGKKFDNNHKWVETGGNYHFKISQEGDKRIFETIPLRESIEIEKRNIIDKKGKIEERDIIILSPNDLVFIPTEEELENPNLLNFDDLNKEQLKRIFVFNDSSGKTAYFRPNSISSAIIKKEVDKTEKKPGSFDTKTTSFGGIQIKDVCIKLKVDRLGNITGINGKPTV